MSKCDCGRDKAEDRLICNVCSDWVTEQGINRLTRWAIDNYCYDGIVQECDMCETLVSKELADVWSDYLVICNKCKEVCND